MDVVEGRRIRYRVPVTAVVVPAVPFLIGSLFASMWLGVAAMGVLLGLASARRHGLELTEQDAVVYRLKPARVPWSSVTAVRSGGWRGGTVLETAAFEDVWAPAPCSWWAGPAPADQVAEVERWWIEHRGPAWTGRPAVALFPVRNTPPVRYRTSEIAGPVAVLGLLVAAVNGAALRWPLGGFTLLFVEFTEPSLDHPGWEAAAAAVAGTVLGAVWAVRAHRVLVRESPPPAAADTRPGDAARPLLLVAAVAIAIAISQWLGMAPAIGSLTMVALGVAAALAGVPLAAGARHFEQRTGRLLLSTNPLSRGLGLETGPPRTSSD